EKPGDQVTMRLSEGKDVTIKSIEGDDGRLPWEAGRNTVSASVLNYLDLIGMAGTGVEIELFKQMPIGSGLGSSAASTVAGLFAINKLMGEPLTPLEMLPLAL